MTRVHIITKYPEVATRGNAQEDLYIFEAGIPPCHCDLLTKDKDWAEHLQLQFEGYAYPLDESLTRKIPEVNGFTRIRVDNTSAKQLLSQLTGEVEGVVK